jgi:hypothetical protein
MATIHDVGRCYPRHFRVGNAFLLSRLRLSSIVRCPAINRFSWRIPPVNVIDSMVRTLDLFLLTLVRDGLRTQYEWQARAGVSLGASLPAVKCLLEGRLVTEAEKGSRGRREFRIARPGRQALQNVNLDLEQTLDERPGDLESVLRLTCMAISEGKIELAKKLLLQAAEEQAKRSRRAGRQASAPPKGSSAADLYTAALAYCDAGRFDETSKSLASLISIFELDSDSRASVPKRRRPRR